MPRSSPTAAQHTLHASDSSALSRRALLRHAAQAAGLACAVPMASVLAGCASQVSTQVSTQAKAGASTVPWRLGGTRAIADVVRQHNPFTHSAASSCSLTCEATIGPCHTQSPLRSDISDGWDGIPMHIQLRIVDRQCQPVANAMVEIWHTNYTGGYSGQIHPMCNNQAEDKSKQFFRGYQRSDAQGVVRFDSCFPGWYRGRANHVHIRVMQGQYDASDSAPASLVTQLLYPDALNQEIFASAALYKNKGQPDTTLNSDNVVGEEPDKSPYLFDIQNLDGVMLASKTLTIGEAGAQLCKVRGRMPAHGPGGRNRPNGQGPQARPARPQFAPPDGMLTPAPQGG